MHAAACPAGKETSTADCLLAAKKGIAWASQADMSFPAPCLLLLDDLLQAPSAQYELAKAPESVHAMKSIWLHANELKEKAIHFLVCDKAPLGLCPQQFVQTINSLRLALPSPSS